MSAQRPNAHASHDAAHSLHDDARREADRHKWIESQKQGRDLGDEAVRDWFRIYWIVYCRFRLLEHLRGIHFWLEFGDDAFRELCSMIGCDDPLLKPILDRMEGGMDNLEIINWAIDEDLPMKRVIEILALIDINRARLEPPV